MVKNSECHHHIHISSMCNAMLSATYAMSALMSVRFIYIMEKAKCILTFFHLLLVSPPF